jgi:hypothetical protein
MSKKRTPHSDFSRLCSETRRTHSKSCFRKAITYNDFAHQVVMSGRKECFAMKTRYVENAIRLAPEAVYVDDFQLTGGGLIGIAYPGVGRLHLKLGDLSEDVQQFVWNQIRLQCSRTRSLAS